MLQNTIFLRQIRAFQETTYFRFADFVMRESPSLVKGVRFRSLSFRSSWVQIPSPAPYDIFRFGILAKFIKTRIHGTS